MRISVFESRELRAAIVTMKGLDRDIAGAVRKHVRAAVLPIWRTELAQHTTTRLENRVLVDSARVTVTDKQVTLKSGALAKRLSGGGLIYQLAPATEFGADQAKRKPVTNASGTTFKRRTGTAFKRRKRAGYVAWPAVADSVPRIAAVWVGTVMRQVHETFERIGR